MSQSIFSDVLNERCLDGVVIVPVIERTRAGKKVDIRAALGVSEIGAFS